MLLTIGPAAFLIIINHSISTSFHLGVIEITTLKMLGYANERQT